MLSYPYPIFDLLWLVSFICLCSIRSGQEKRTKRNCHFFFVFVLMYCRLYCYIDSKLVSCSVKKLWVLRLQLRRIITLSVLVIMHDWWWHLTLLLIHRTGNIRCCWTKSRRILLWQLGLFCFLYLTMYISKVPHNSPAIYASRSDIGISTKQRYSTVAHMCHYLDHLKIGEVYGINCRTVKMLTLI